MNYENLNDARKIQEYVTNMRPTFNKRAVFSDETENYRTPAEPEAGDTVNIRIRTKKNNVDFMRERTENTLPFFSIAVICSDYLDNNVVIVR